MALQQRGQCIQSGCASDPLLRSDVRFTRSDRTVLTPSSRWTATFLFIFWLSHKQKKYFGYEMAVVQSFVAGSNNFVRVHTLLTRNKHLTL